MSYVRYAGMDEPQRWQRARGAPLLTMQSGMKQKQQLRWGRIGGVESVVPIRQCFVFSPFAFVERYQISFFLPLVVS